MKIINRFFLFLILTVLKISAQETIDDIPPLSPLEELATELKFKIFNYLEFPDLQKLRQVSSSLKADVESVITRTLTHKPDFKIDEKHPLSLYKNIFVKNDLFKLIFLKTKITADNLVYLSDSQLRHLEFIQCDYDSDTTTPAGVETKLNHSLETLIIRGGKLTNFAVNFLNCLEFLEYLVLDSTELPATFPDNLKPNNNLKKLELSSMSIHLDDLNRIFKNLVEIEFAWCQIVNEAACTSSSLLPNLISADLLQCSNVVTKEDAEALFPTVRNLTFQPPKN